MIQFNLLPDVKLEYIKAQRTRRLSLSIAFLATAVSVALLGVLIGFGQLQNARSNALSDNIAANTKKLQNQKDIDKILTVQNQLDKLTDLHATKPAMGRLFDYLNAVTPAEVNITSYSADLEANTTTIIGTSGSLSSVNKYVDTLKFTKYHLDSDKDSSQLAFGDVVLSSFSLSDTSGATGAAANQKANYSITLTYQPDLFDITKKVTIDVPSTTTTRSEVAKPTDLFTGNPNAKTTETR